MDLARVVSGDQRPWTQTCWTRESGYGEQSEPKFNVVAYDFGVKRNTCVLAERVAGSPWCPTSVRYWPCSRYFSINGPGDPEPGPPCSDW